MDLKVDIVGGEALPREVDAHTRVVPHHAPALAAHHQDTTPAQAKLVVHVN